MQPAAICEIQSTYSMEVAAETCGQAEPTRWKRGGPVVLADVTNAGVWIVSANYRVAVVENHSRLRRLLRLR